MIRDLTVLALIGSLVWYLLAESDDGNGAKIATAADNTNTASLGNAAVLGPSSPFTSPFGMGKFEVENAQQRQTKRRTRMHQLKYRMPEQYFSMSLKELNALAEKNDAFALIQLGEQYESEWASLLDDPAFERNVDPQRRAELFFLLAIRSGYPQVAAIMAQKSSSGGNAVNANAWGRIAQVFNNSQPLGRVTGGPLTPAQQKDADEMVKRLRFQLGMSAAE